MSMPYSVPLRVSRSGGEKGNNLARLDVSSVRHVAMAFKAIGRPDKIPSRCRKARGSSLPSVAAKWPFARWVISLRAFSSFACRVTDREAWKSLSRPRCTSSRRRVTSSRAISASGDIVLPRLKERDWADSKRTFCHSRVRAACSAGIGPRWMDRSIGAPAAIRLWRNPGDEGPGPLAQVERPHKAVSDPHLAAAHLHVHRRLLVKVSRRAAEGGGHEEHPQAAAAEGVDGQPGPAPAGRASRRTGRTR